MTEDPFQLPVVAEADAQYRRVESEIRAVDKIAAQFKGPCFKCKFYDGERVADKQVTALCRNPLVGHYFFNRMSGETQSSFPQIMPWSPDGVPEACGKDRALFEKEWAWKMVDWSRYTHRWGDKTLALGFLFCALYALMLVLR